ncbi:MAG: gluconolactonase [Rhizobacter sp.]
MPLKPPSVSRPFMRCWGALVLCCAAPVLAQNLPDIFSSVPRLPLAVKVQAEFPEMTFLENLVVTGKDIVFTSHEDGKVYRLSPSQPPRLLAVLPGKVTGIAPAVRGGFLLTGFDPSGLTVVHHVDKRGTVLSTTAIRDAVFLNGIERIGPDRYLIADSYKGVLWKYDAVARQATVWLDSPLLQRSDERNPVPAANGVRLHGREVLVSNTAKMLLLRVPLRSDGGAGELSVWKEKLNIDDFAVARDGTVWGATHIYNSLVRIDPQGGVAVVAEESQGFAGSTSAALSGDGKTLFVTTNGGMFLPPPQGVQKARLLAVSVRP